MTPTRLQMSFIDAALLDAVHVHVTGMTPHLCRGFGWEPDTSAVFQRLIRSGDHVMVRYVAIITVSTHFPLEWVRRKPMCPTYASQRVYILDSTTQFSY